MADETVVTELIIDARGAEVGSAAYVKAMKAAQAAADRAIDSANDVAKAVETQSTVMSSSAGSITSTAKAWERLKASVDPAYRATKDMERALITADAAARKLGIDEVERARVLDLVRQKTDAVSAATKAGTAHIASVGTAARLTSNQMLNLSRQGNDVITMFALGAPPMQIFASQAGQIFDALESGPAGALGSLKILGAGILSFVATPLGGILTAATLAGGAIAAYALATRNDIKSADEVLKGHKALIDEIAKAYPAAAAAAKKYEDQASQMPKSAVAANTADNQSDAQKTLAKTMNDVRRQFDLLNSGDGDFSRIGKAGLAAFANLSAEIRADTIDAAGLQNELNKLRLDPALSKNAHDFAKGLSDGTHGIVDQAVALAALIPANKAIKDIAVGGQRAVQTLADVAGGFKDTGSKASSADATIAKLFGDMSGGSDGFGVTRSLGGSFQGVVGQFEQAGQAIQNMRREQVQSMLDLTKQFRDTTTQVAELKDAIASAATDSVNDFFGGDVSNIKNANSELQNSVDTVNKLFDALNSGGTSAQNVASGLDMIRQTLVNDGFGVDQVNKFIDSLIKARMQMDAGVNDAAQLNRAIQAIKNRTVTITVVTQQVGTGTKSVYDVPNGSGGTSGVGVTRYGSGTAPSMSAYSVPSAGGYGSQGGTANGGGTSTVGVTRFSSTSHVGYVPYTDPTTGTTGYMPPGYDPAANNYRFSEAFATGGMIHPGDSQRVSFFKSPEETVGIFTPNQMNALQGTSLADPQSAFTGREATREQDRLWTVLMNIEANTRKTYEGVDKLAVSSSYSGSGGGSSGSDTSIGSSTSSGSAYARVLAQVRANFHAAGIVGGGSIGYGGQGLAATPEQIARNIVNGTSSPLGSPGANDYENTLARTDADRSATEARRHKAVYGFASGGMIGGDSRDTQEVQFFKRPREKVIIADDDQISDQRGSGSSKSSTGDRPIEINMPIYMQAGAQVNKDSTAELRRQVANAVRDGLRSINGR